MTYAEKYEEKFDSTWAEQLKRLPEHMHGGIYRYVVYGVPAGSFLSAVIQNDLRKAVFAADPTNYRQLKDFVSFFYECTPADCQGDELHYLSWIEKGGSEGLLKQENQETD